MKGTLTLVARTPALRAAAGAIACFGFAGAATGPYVAVLGVREMGMADAAYSAMLIAASVGSVAASVWTGMMADAGGRHRRLMLLCALAGVLGHTLIWAGGAPWTLALALIGPLSFFNALYAMVFAAARRHSAGRPKADSAAVSSLMRAIISLSWIAMPAVIGLAFAGAASMRPAFGLAALFALCAFALLAMLMPADGRGAAPIAAPQLAPRELVRLLMRPALAVRVLCVAMISALLSVNQVVMPLIATGRMGGTTSHIGIAFGIVCALEVTFILVWDRVARRIAPTAALAVGVALYAVYLVGLASVSAPTQLYALSILSGIGAAAVISLPLAILQDLVPDRPGLSASLLSVNMLLAGAIGAGLFALGSAWGGYGVAGALGAVVGLAGAAGLLALDGWRLRAVA